jgi:hypothetical protein
MSDGPAGDGPMSDDFRVRATFESPARAAAAARRLLEGTHERELGAGAGDRVAVSLDERDREVFLYADSRQRAEAAQAALQRLARSEGWALEVELRRWHPVAEEWAHADEPLPASPEEVAAERAERVAQEREESRRRGAPEWEVRLALPSHRDTVELAERLRVEGIPSTRRWRYLLIGAEDEDTANSLAARLRAEAPPGTEVTVEGTLSAVSSELPPSPFAFFGGLGG